MPSYTVKRSIVRSCKACAAAAVPGAFVPIIDIGVVGGVWLAMMTDIAEEHHVSFDNSPLHFAGTIAAGIGTYIAGSRLATWGITATLTVFTGGLAIFVLPSAMNAAFTAYYTYSVGMTMDRVFSNIDGSEATDEIAMQILRAVRHVPSISELHEFAKEVWDSL